MEKRYRALRFIGTIYKILGIIAAVLTLLAALSICGAGSIIGAFMDSMLQDYVGGSGGGTAGGVIGGVIMALVALLYGGGLAVTLYAFGEGIYLFLAIEENTRASMLLLQRQP